MKCNYCHKEFNAPNFRQIYCSQGCKQKNAYEKTKIPKVMKTKICHCGCHEIFQTTSDNKKFVNKEHYDHHQKIKSERYYENMRIRKETFSIKRIEKELEKIMVNSKKMINEIMFYDENIGYSERKFYEIENRECWKNI